MSCTRQKEYLLITYLSFSTFTATVTVPTEVVVSATEVDVSTQVDIVVVATQTNVEEQTETVSETLTVVDTISTTRTVPPVQTITFAPRALGKRCEQRPFPTYASACSSFKTWASACSCIGVFPSTTTVAAPSTTITVTEVTTVLNTVVTTTSTTETILSSVTDTTLTTSLTTLTTTDATTTVLTTATTTVTATPDPNIVKNGGFETGSLQNWKLSSGSISASAVKPGSSSVYSLKTGNLYDNNLFELSQKLTGVAGSTYACSYSWKYTNYYETKYSDGVTYVPYVHVYINNDVVSNRRPDAGSVNQWQTAYFDFTSSGQDTLWFDCASPQPRFGSKGGNNYLSLDDVSCVPIV